MAGVEIEIVNVESACVLRVKGKMVSGAASQSLRAAFEKARTSIENRERAANRDPSEPTAYFGAAVEQKLAGMEASANMSPR